MRTLLFAFALFGLMAISPRASAEDFRFTVPVRIENMRFVEVAHVSCALLASDGGAMVSMPGQTTIPLVDGAYTGTITVPVSVRAGLTRDMVRSWSCEIAYFWHTPDGIPYTRSVLTGARNSTYTSTTGQAIASSTLSATGPLPPP